MHNATSSDAMLNLVPLKMRGLNCAEVYQELENLAEHDSRLEKTIQGNRGKNQTVGYFAAVLFPPLLFAAENDKSIKALLDQNQRQRDHLILVQKAKRCSTTE